MGATLKSDPILKNISQKLEEAYKPMYTKNWLYRIMPRGGSYGPVCKIFHFFESFLINLYGSYPLGFTYCHKTLKMLRGGPKTNASKILMK